MSATRSVADRRAAANAIIQKALARIKASPAASALAGQVQAGTHFDAVITSIDNMITTLKQEENDDLKNKEDCEKDRMDDTRDAVVAAREIDDFTETIVRLRAEIAEIEVQIEKAQAEVDDIIKDLAEALKVRNAENKEFLKNKQDDIDAKALVVSAKGVLTKFYQDNNLDTLVFQQLPKVVAGEAPPPPPKTWSAPYGGAGRESSGIIAILGMIAEDIQRDIDAGVANEGDAVTAYDAAKTKMNTEKTNLGTMITDLGNSKTTKETDVTNTKNQRQIKKGTLDTEMTKIEGAEEGCNYFTINYVVRRQNRQAEIDGLLKAKTILEGGVFDAPDPNREIKPGDALVQVHH